MVELALFDEHVRVGVSGHWRQAGPIEPQDDLPPDICVREPPTAALRGFSG
jgi:hypothetical protein